MAKVTNVNDVGTVGIQTGDDTSSDEDTTEITNVTIGGVVGIQGAVVSDSTVIITGQ